MQDYLRRTWATVDLDRVVQNYRQVKDHLTPGCEFMAVVKADAYGHGDGYVSRALDRSGAGWFGVSNLSEALSLRKQGVMKPVLILGYTPPQAAATLHAMGISQTVYSPDYAAALSAQAAQAGVEVDCHIKVDTGMSRIGFYAQQGHEQAAAGLIGEACRLPGLRCTGCFTHFACADERSPDSDSFTRRQFAAFMKTLALLKTQGVAFRLRHCCNSAGALRFPEMHLDMVRVGVLLYGLAPSPECRELCDLAPVMGLHTIVTMVKELEPGAAVSYGRRYTVGPKGGRVASIAVGYADGYHRSQTNRGRVLLHGQYAPVVGTVCMDQLMIDVSHIPQVQMGDQATLVGQEQGRQITLDDFAALAGTINYEEACLIGRRVPRVYIEGGREAGVVDYVG